MPTPIAAPAVIEAAGTKPVGSWMTPAASTRATGR
jgi:hypothetical protein